MRTIEEVESMVYGSGLTVAKGSINRVTEVKDVNKEYQARTGQGETFVHVYQKKKGKPTKKVTAFGLCQNGHFSFITYALLTTDSELRELIRNANGKEN